MKKPATFLVPTDLSAFSLEALDYAQQISELFRARLHLLFVIQGQKKRARFEVDEAEVDARKKLLEFLINRKIVPDEVRVEIRHGQPAEEIVRAAKDLHADLIIMSTHGRTGLSHILIGSVTEEVVRFSTVPVLTLKPERFTETVEWKEEDIKAKLNLN